MPDSLTITVLPDLLALVHIPRSRLVHFSHHVVKQILAPAPSFLNITCNKIELSLFAHHSILTEFEPLARKDRQRLQRLSSVSHHSHRRCHVPTATFDQLEISYDTWNVLQLDSHDDRLDNAGTRVRELSAPLADAGIPILYQSSYTSDFIFVKSSRLNQVLAKLSKAGFVGYSFDIASHLSPTVSGSQNSNVDIRSPMRRSIDGTVTEFVLQRDNGPPPSDSSSSPSGSGTVTPSPGPSALASRTSISPCARDVQILNQDIVCVGLSDASADVWASKIIKLVAYPELIIGSHVNGAVEEFFEHALASPSPVDDPEMHSTGGIDIPQPRAEFWMYPSPSASSCSSVESSSPSEDGYFSSTSCTPSGPGKASLAPSLVWSRSYPEMSEIARPVRVRLPRPDTVSGNLSQIVRPVKRTDHPVPFFSFTRTAEGSSLTTGRELLTALFSPSERHMVICGNELMDEEPPLDDSEWSQQIHKSREASPVSASTMKCLQIDLQRFGLDKHGLISRFSKVLDSNGINHMYSSTYKTANLLVSKKDALQAANLLRQC